jgi:hypothetical protein
MTRINAGVTPRTLCDKHLMAEHREIKRIPNCVRKGRANLENIPDSFRLGTGHVSFFYDKLGFLKNRYDALHTECLRRGFNVQNYEGAWEGIPTELLKDWKPSVKDVALVAARIAERLNTSVGGSIIDT